MIDENLFSIFLEAQRRHTQFNTFPQHLQNRYARSARLKSNDCRFRTLARFYARPAIYEARNETNGKSEFRFYQTQLASTANKLKRKVLSNSRIAELHQTFLLILWLGVFFFGDSV